MHLDKLSNWQEWGILSLFVAFGLLICGMTFFGCSQKRLNPSDVVVQTKPSKGRCTQWHKIERETFGHTLCSEWRTFGEFRVFCTRRLGHDNEHHMHGTEGDCYWIW